MQSFQQGINTKGFPTNTPSIDEEAPLKTDSHRNSLEKLSLSPFLVNTLGSFDCIFASYCPRHSMIIVCFFDRKMSFYDANTLLPSEGRKVVQLDGSVTCMAYDDETDTFLIGCGSGSIYTYNASNEELKKVRKCEEHVQTVTFLNSRFYALGLSRLKGLAIGSLDDENLQKVYPQDRECVTLEYLPTRNLLFTSFQNGFVRIYRTDKLPYLQNLPSIKACPKAGRWVTAIKVINLNGEEYIVTSGRDCTVRIWRLNKRRMRLLRVIRTERVVYWLVYLENYKAIATIYDRSNKIEFWGVFSGKLEKTFVSEKNRVIWGLFVMKDKNTVGAIGGNGIRYDSIEFIQLHPCEEK